MGKIKDLRDKVKSGTATPEEIAELEELETEAKEGETTEEETVSVDEQIKAAAAKFMNIISENTESASDARKSAISEKGESKTTEKALEGEEKTQAFVKALFGNDKVKLQVHSEGTAANGGFLVPEAWNSTLIEDRRDATVIRPRATVVPVTVDTFHVPQLATRPKVYWTNEAAVKSTSTATFSEITLTPYVLAVIVVVTRQLAADAVVGGNVISLLTKLIVQAIAEEEDNVFIGGSGSGRPTGINTYTFAKSTNAGGAISGDHIISTFYGLGQQYRNRAYWLMNPRTMSAVKGLKDSNNRYLFDGALTSEGFPTLQGRPVLESNHVPASDIYFGDLSAYWIAEREGISVLTSEQATIAGISMFERNEIALRVEERIDGELTDTRAFAEITNSGVS